MQPKSCSNAAVVAIAMSSKQNFPVHNPGSLGPDALGTAFRAGSPLGGLCLKGRIRPLYGG